MDDIQSTILSLITSYLNSEDYHVNQLLEENLQQIEQIGMLEQHNDSLQRELEEQQDRIIRAIP